MTPTATATAGRKVSLVILCWNRWALTERCLATLKERTDLARAEVIVVDNGSTDETPARLRERPWLKVVTNAENLGYVRGNNAGIAAADPANDVLLLNNDVEILHEGWLEELSRVAREAPKAGVVGCRLVRHADGLLLHAGTYILPDTFWGQQIGALETEVGQYRLTREVEGIVFACAYIRREVIAAIGGLSTDFESYFEDTDYCLRARQAGFLTYLAGGVTIRHHEHGSTSDAPETFGRVFERSRAVFARKWKKPLEERYRHTSHWQSILNFSTGYAMSCREILRALEAEGVRSSYEYVYGKGTPFPLDEKENAGDYLLNVLRSRRPATTPEVSVVYAQGDVFDRSRGRYKVGYTMLEVDGFPAEWVRQANRMDEVWVPSAANREAMLRCGVKRPVHVMGLGVDVDHFNPLLDARPNPRGEYVFLSSFEWGERKAPEVLLKVFNQTFRRSDPVVLVCKVMNRNVNLSLRREIEGLELSSFGGRVLFLHNRELPYHQLGMLYRSADAYVSAGRGEGWDMPLMEAMACGLPAIATDWGAHTEFVHEGIAYPLKTRGTIPAKALCPYYDGFSWADPDPEHLEALLLHVFENREEAREKGRRAAEEMRERWTWRHAARRIVGRLASI